MSQPITILAPISVGELLDKITILELKQQRLTDPVKIKNVAAELERLKAVRQAETLDSPELSKLVAALKGVNTILWETEDDLRDCEREQLFDGRFIELARSVYRQNDRRSVLKRQINELVGSDIIEEKSYTSAGE